MIRKSLLFIFVCGLLGSVRLPAAFAADAQQMKPTGKRCAGIGEYCSFNGKMMVRIAGCKSIDRYNGGCASSPGVLATNGIACSYAAFGLKGPLQDVGKNACYVQTLAEAGLSGSSSSSSSSSGGITGASCVSGGEETVNATIMVTKGVYDGVCKTFNAGPGLKHTNGDRTGDKPIFRVENGAILRNVIIGNNIADHDGIHVYNGGTLDNIRWTRIGERAVTVKSAGNVIANNISAANGRDQLFQIDAPATLNVSNCVVDNLHRFVGQSTGTTFRVTVAAEHCQISNIVTSVFSSDSPGSIARLTKSRLHKADVLCKGPWVSCTDIGNAYY